MAFDSGRVFANYFYSYVCQFTKFYRTFLIQLLCIWLFVLMFSVH